MINKKRILVICIEKVSSVSAGVLFPLEELEKKALIEVKFVRTSKVTEADIKWCDTVICVRGSEFWDLHIVRLCKKYGRQAVYYLDDDLLDIPDNVSCTDYYKTDYVLKSIQSLMKECDILWCVNPNIAKKYGNCFKKTVLSEACVKRDCSCVADDDKVKFIYAGGIDHQNIVEEILSPVVNHLCNKYGEKVQFTFIGVDPHLSNQKQVKFIPYISDYQEYRRVVCETHYDISFAPVYDTPFYSCKYYNKFLEYTSMGTVGIYSDLQPYTFVVENYENGILADNNDSWCKAAEYLIDNPEERKRILENAEKTFDERFTSEKIAAELVSEFPELCEFSAPDITGEKVRINNLQLNFYNLKQRLTMYFRRRGIAGIFLLPFKAIKTIIKKIRETEKCH